MSKSSMTNTDIVRHLLESVLANVEHKRNDLGMTRQAAIQAVQSESTAGPAVWKLAIPMIQDDPQQEAGPQRED